MLHNLLAIIIRYCVKWYNLLIWNLQVIGQEVYESLSSLSEHKQHILFSLLHHTCCTVVGEILQPQSQHIVNLSYLPKPRLAVISFTLSINTDNSAPGATLTALPPHHSLDIAKSLGLNTATYNIIDFKDFLEQRMKVRISVSARYFVIYIFHQCQKITHKIWETLFAYL